VYDWRTTFDRRAYVGGGGDDEYDTRPTDSVSINEIHGRRHAASSIKPYDDVSRDVPSLLGMQCSACFWR